MRGSDFGRHPPARHPYKLQFGGFFGPPYSKQSAYGLHPLIHLPCLNGGRHRNWRARRVGGGSPGKSSWYGAWENPGWGGTPHKRYRLSCGGRGENARGRVRACGESRPRAHRYIRGNLHWLPHAGVASAGPATGYAGGSPNMWRPRACRLRHPPLPRCGNFGTAYSLRQGWYVWHG